MYKLDFLGVTQKEYDILRLFRDAIANTKRRNTPSWYTVNVDTENHETAYHLCDGYDFDATIHATAEYLGSGRDRFVASCSAEGELREQAENKGATTLHMTRMENPRLYLKHARRIASASIKVKPLNLSEILAEDPARLDTNPTHCGIGGLIEVRDINAPKDYESRGSTYQTLYGAITGNTGNELELGNLGDKCYACGNGIKFGIKEQYPLLTKEQQESVVGRAWGLLEAFYKDIRWCRGDFSEIPSVDEILMLVHGYGLFPEPAQGKKRKQGSWKRNHVPIEHEEIVESLQEDEPVDDNIGSPKEEGSRRKSRRVIETLFYVIIVCMWCTPLGKVVGLENLPIGFKLVGALILLRWGYRILRL